MGLSEREKAIAWQAWKNAGDPPRQTDEVRVCAAVEAVLHERENGEVQPIPFEDWWSTQGRFIDPDMEDVPWYDKREGLAGMAYIAGQSSVKFAAHYTKPARAQQETPLTRPEPGHIRRPHFGNPCIYCGIAHDEVDPGPCKGHGHVPMPHASDCAVWVGEGCNCITGRFYGL